MQNLISEYEVVVGVLLPLLISIFIKESWGRTRKIGVSFIFVFLASIGNVFYSGDWNLANFGTTILKILVLSVTTYKGFWSATGLTDTIEKKVGLKIIAPFLILPMLMFGSMNLSACVTTGQTGASSQGTVATQSSMVYAQAQEAYLNAWNSYHAVWSALPETDPRKAQWTKDYHPKFLLAANALVSWEKNTGSASSAQAANAAIDALTGVLLQLAIPSQKGGK